MQTNSGPYSLDDGTRQLKVMTNPTISRTGVPFFSAVRAYKAGGGAVTAEGVVEPTAATGLGDYRLPFSLF